MKARLISYTQPDNIIGVDNAQELIAYCARVSNPGNQNNKEKKGATQIYTTETW